jgi:O-antigen/teichoic acid export membrane protein
MPGFMTLLTNLFLLIFVLTCNASGLNNNIIRLSIAYLLAVNLPLMITTVYLFSNMLYYAKPSIKFFDLSYAMDTLKTGGMFLLIQLFKLAIYSTNLILITKLVSSSAVVEYNIYHKVFSLINSIFVLGLTPIWSAVTRAAAENNYLWIKKVSNVMYAFGGLVALSQLLLYPVVQVLFDVWLGSETIKVNYSILIFYMIDEGVGIWSGIAGYISNGLNQLKLQVITMGIGALLKIPLSILGVKISGSYAGVILAHSVSLLPFCLLQTIWLYRHINGKLCKDAEFMKGAELSGNPD